MLAPTARVLCAYPEDGNSMLKTCEPLGGDGVRCIPGCSADGEQCQQVGHDWSCSFGGRDGLRLAMQHQRERGGYLERNNEVVLAADSVLGGALPHSVHAIFYMVGADPVHVAKARQTRDDFAHAFGLAPHAAPPLLALDLADGVAAPFSLAE